MQKLYELSKKKKKYVVGLMSGTSVDGTDAALIEIEGKGINTKINLIGFMELPFPDGLKEMILRNSLKETSSVDEISQLNFLIARVYADTVKRLCAETDFPLENIDLIGSHGQTVHHIPGAQNLCGYKIASTFQIGDPAVLAKLTGIITVGDFRTGDVALGGQGAPLVPYFDYLLFHSSRKDRILVNIGGISNITYLEKGAGIDNILAFDTGPGNMLIDYLTKVLYGEEFDKDGSHAESGRLHRDFLDELVSTDTFIEKRPPKSTGREYYNSRFIEGPLKKFEDLSEADLLNTVTNFTAYGIYRNFVKFIDAKDKPVEIFISGGGARNKYLYACIMEYFKDSAEVKIIDEIGISSDAKEAICFAVMANETISGNPTNIPKTTGASRSTVLGKICLP